MSPRGTLRAALASIVLLAACAGDDADAPRPRTPEATRMQVQGWQALHADHAARARRGGLDLVFLGDSITAAWEEDGREVWAERYAHRRAAAFGIPGDTTDNLLWRVQEGHELAGLAPKVVVVLIGTNDLTQTRRTPARIAEGVRAVLAAVRAAVPDSRVLLLGVFPRDARPNSAFRASIRAINAALAPADDGVRVRFLDLEAAFLAPDGSIPRDVMGDGLHLTAKGYRLWAERIDPLLAEMLAGGERRGQVLDVESFPPR